MGGYCSFHAPVQIISFEWTNFYDLSATDIEKKLRSMKEWQGKVGYCSRIAKKIV